MPGDGIKRHNAEVFRSSISGSRRRSRRGWRSTQWPAPPQLFDDLETAATMARTGRGASEPPKSVKNSPFCPPVGQTPLPAGHSNRAVIDINANYTATPITGDIVGVSGRLVNAAGKEGV
jgi:hypothetical protein